ncbi:hypothetical protein VNO80_29217 [Phaseolus coccineus]|uniref:Uncharacterized protein n=1 Tax=Phaseolus coccineus TaxID=3886 RepID=A0AAN9QC78_PHACN
MEAILVVLLCESELFYNCTEHFIMTCLLKVPTSNYRSFQMNKHKVISSGWSTIMNSVWIEFGAPYLANSVFINAIAVISFSSSTNLSFPFAHIKPISRAYKSFLAFLGCTYWAMGPLCDIECLDAAFGKERYMDYINHRKKIKGKVAPILATTSSLSTVLSLSLLKQRSCVLILQIRLFVVPEDINGC